MYVHQISDTRHDLLMSQHQHTSCIVVCTVRGLMLANMYQHSASLANFSSSCFPLPNHLVHASMQLFLLYAAAGKGDDGCPYLPAAVMLLLLKLAWAIHLDSLSHYFLLNGYTNMNTFQFRQGMVLAALRAWLGACLVCICTICMCY